MKKKKVGFSWFVVLYAVFAVFTYEAEQAPVDKAVPDRAQHSGHSTSIVPDTRGQGPSTTIRHGTLPDDSLEQLYDGNYMHYDPEHNLDADDEWHDYFND